MVSFPAAILSELQHHLNTYSLNGPDGWVLSTSTGSRGTAETSTRNPLAGGPQQIGLSNLHLHDVATQGNAGR